MLRWLQYTSRSQCDDCFACTYLVQKRYIMCVWDGADHCGTLFKFDSYFWLDYLARSGVSLTVGGAYGVREWWEVDIGRVTFSFILDFVFLILRFCMGEGHGVRWSVRISWWIGGWLISRGWHVSPFCKKYALNTLNFFSILFNRDLLLSSNFLEALPGNVS